MGEYGLYLDKVNCKSYQNSHRKLFKYPKFDVWLPNGIAQLCCEVTVVLEILLQILSETPDRVVTRSLVDHSSFTLYNFRVHTNTNSSGVPLPSLSRAWSWSGRSSISRARVC